MQFYFVRHGESAHNAKNLFCGSVDSPLTKKGIRQSMHAASALDNTHLDWIVSSPMVRAFRTAQWLATRHGLVVTTDTRLIEHKKGLLEGTPHTKMKSAAWENVEGAESMVDLYKRVHAALVNLEKRPGVGAIVAHAGIARAIEAIATNTPPEDLYDLKKASNADPYLVTLGYGQLMAAAP